MTDRQKEIISASLKLIAEKGIQGLTIKNLANSIGITEPAIYRHYENKIQILIAILEHFKHNTEQIYTIEKNKNLKAIDKIQKIFSNHFEVFVGTPSLVPVIFSEEIFRNETILIKRVTEIMERNDKILNAVIMKGQEEGDIRNDLDHKYLSVVIMGTLRLFIKKWQLSDYSFDLMEEGNTIIQAIKLLISKNK